MRKILATLLLGGALAAASGIAAAHTSIGVGVYVRRPRSARMLAPPPVAYYPRPASYAPPVAYAAPPVYYAPAPVYYGPPVVYRALAPVPSLSRIGAGKPAPSRKAPRAWALSPTHSRICAAT